MRRTRSTERGISVWPIRKRGWLLSLGVALALLSATLVAQAVRFNCTTCIFPGVIQIVDGSNSAPALVFTSDPTTGLFRYSAGVLGVAGSIFPAFDNTYDLGSGAARWRNLFLSGALGAASFSAGDGSDGAPSFLFTNNTALGFFNLSTAIGVSGSLWAGSDSTYDLGQATANRFNNGYFAGLVTGTSFQVGAGTPSTNNVSLQNDGIIGLFGADYLGVHLGDSSNYGGQKVRVIDTEGLQLDPSFGDVQPTCSSTYRGVLWLVQGASGVADQLQACGKAGDNSYAWVTVL